MGYIFSFPNLRRGKQASLLYPYKADPGFTRRRSQPQTWGPQPTIWPIYFPKPDEDERNWTGVLGDPPMSEHTDFSGRVLFLLIKIYGMNLLSRNYVVQLILALPGWKPSDRSCLDL